MDPDPARRFLDAVAGIEKLLKASLRTRKFTPLKEMATSSRAAGALTEDQYTALIALADLRNALSHDDYRNGTPIATPREATVEEAERLLAFLQRPPRALDQLERYAVRSVKPSDPLAIALEFVKDDFSQFPIYDANGYVGLLTTNAIGRWLADQFTKVEMVQSEATVEELFAYAETSDVAVAIRADATTTEAIRVLGNDDAPVRAVIFTATGDINEVPLAVAVREDVHRLLHSPD